MPQSKREKAIHAKINPSTTHEDRFKLLGKTSGKMGVKKEEFAMFGGKVVSPSEKIKLEEQKALKEKKQKNENPSVAPKQQSKESILQRLKGEGFKITTELSSDPDEPEDEPTEFTTIEITEKQTLDAINGKRTAREMMDFITGTTEDQRLKYDIDTNNKLFELNKAGKIKHESDTNIWKKV